MRRAIRVLVVDDDIAWQKVMLFMLGKKGGYEAKVVSTLSAAQHEIATQKFDVVITDLMLTRESEGGESGLSLLDSIEEADLHLPVIVVSGKDDAEAVIETLQHGAASYILKTNIRSELFEVLDSVVNTLDRSILESRLQDSITELSMTFDLQSDTQFIAPLIEKIRTNILMLSLFKRTKTTQLLIAVEEALCNAIIHGNLEISSAIREVALADYYSLIRERVANPEFGNRRVQVQISINQARLNFRIHNEGNGFDYERIQDPREDDNMELSSGRGILLMKTFMDHVEYSDSGRCVEMTKILTGNLEQQTVKLETTQVIQIPKIETESL